MPKFMDPRLKSALIGGGIGAAGGGALFHQVGKAHKKENEDRKTPGRSFNPKRLAKSGLIIGGLIGAEIGSGHSALHKNFYNALKDKGFKSNAHHIGTAAGAALGGYQARRGAKKANEEAETNKKKPKFNVNAATATGAVLGGAGGHLLGNSVRMAKGVHFSNFNKGREYGRTSRAKTNIGPPSWAKSAKTKDEAKKAFRAEAVKHHPDKGGDVRKMQDLNKEWEDYKNSTHFDKLSSVLDSFLTELLSIYSE